MFKRPEGSYPRTYRSNKRDSLVPAAIFAFFFFAFWCSLHTWGEVGLMAAVLVIGVTGTLIYAYR